MNEEFDFNRIGLLLMVVKELTGHPKLGNLLNAALAELQEMNDGPKEEPEEVPVEEPSEPEVVERRV